MIEKFFCEQYWNNIFEPNLELLQKEEKVYGYSLQKVKNAQTLRDLHQAYSCQIHGYSDTYELFSLYDINSKTFENLEIPIFFLHSKDDYICSTEFFPFETLKKKKNLFYSETNYGGHVGWFTGLFSPHMVKFNFI